MDHNVLWLLSTLTKATFLCAIKTSLVDILTQQKNVAFVNVRNNLNTALNTLTKKTMSLKHQVLYFCIYADQNVFRLLRAWRKATFICGVKISTVVYTWTNNYAFVNVCNNLLQCLWGRPAAYPRLDTRTVIHSDSLQT